MWNFEPGARATSHHLARRSYEERTYAATLKAMISTTNLCIQVTELERKPSEREGRNWFLQDAILLVIIY